MEQWDIKCPPFPTHISRGGEGRGGLDEMCASSNLCTKIAEVGGKRLDSDKGTNLIFDGKKQRLHWRDDPEIPRAGVQRASNGEEHPR